MIGNNNKAKIKMVSERFAIDNNPKTEKKREKKTQSIGETSLLRK